VFDKNRFGDASTFAKKYNKNFWELYNLGYRELKSFSKDDWDAIQVIGKQASEEIGFFLGDILELFVENYSSLNVQKKTRNSKLKEVWAGKVKITNTKNRSMDIWAEVTIKYELYLGVWTRYSEDRKLLKIDWDKKGIKTHFAKELGKEEWDNQVIFFHPPIDIDLDNLGKLKEDINLWFKKTWDLFNGYLHLPKL
jgi:hypothetical protein